jgi:hypothetical protein
MLNLDDCKIKMHEGIEFFPQDIALSHLTGLALLDDSGEVGM